VDYPRGVVGRRPVGEFARCGLIFRVGPQKRKTLLQPIAPRLSRNDVAHPEVDRYPWFDDDELQELADNIATNGLREPIKRLPDGRIIDGRNRELACFVAGVVPDYVTVDLNETAVRGFVRSQNMLRRHLLRRHLTLAFRRELLRRVDRGGAPRAPGEVEQRHRARSEGERQDRGAGPGRVGINFGYSEVG